LTFHPRPDKALVFAGDKAGNLGIFDASDSENVLRVKKESKHIKFEGDVDDEEEEAVPAITTFHLHSRTISNFLFPPSTPSKLLSASYDSSIRSLDLGASKAVEVYAPDDPDMDEPVSGMEVPSDSPSTIYFSTLNGTFGRHDMRAPKTNAGGTVLTLLSEKKIGGFTLHPNQPHLMATASLDRKLKIWDLRKMSDQDGPSLLGEHESRLSVSHACWNSVGQVATASYDDTVKIHDFSQAGSWTAKTQLSEAEMKPTTVIRHNNQTGRWVTM
jgi:WD40 repeat protein